MIFDRLRPPCVLRLWFVDAAVSESGMAHLSQTARDPKPTLDSRAIIAGAICLDTKPPLDREAA